MATKQAPVLFQDKRRRRKAYKNAGRACKIKAKIIPRIHNSKKHDLAKEIPLSTPYSIHIDPCSLCNFKCKFCFQSDERAKNIPMGKMSMNLYEKIIDDLCQFPNRIKKVKLGLHGEPLLNLLLPKMIVYLKSRNITDTIELFTNGYLLNQYPQLTKAGLNRINISIEGLDSKQYKEITGAKVYMSRLINNIKELYKYRGKCKIYIKTITQDKERFFNMFGNICDEIFVENIVPQWSGIGDPELPKVGMYGQPIKEWKEVCPFPFMYLHYNWNGSVSPCTLDWQREVIIGDANKESAVEIWNGDKIRKLREMMLQGRRREIPFCDKCFAPMVCCEENLDNLIKK